MVGQTEHELTKANIPYEYGIARYSEIAKGMMIGDEIGGMLKLLFHQETRKVPWPADIQNATDLYWLSAVLTLSLSLTMRAAIGRTRNWGECH